MFRGSGPQERTCSGAGDVTYLHLGRLKSDPELVAADRHQFVDDQH